MRLVCAPLPFRFPTGGDLHVILYGQRNHLNQASAGTAARHEILRQGLLVEPRAWDFLSLALSVLAADFAGNRELSPDGWTREFEVDVAVREPEFWMSQAPAIESALAFLTTDRWCIRFTKSAMRVPQPRKPRLPREDCVVLLSGGLDSLIGAIDLAAKGRKPFAVSQTVRGDAEKQIDFAQSIGGGLHHLQVNHNVELPNGEESSQRARSLIFLAFGVASATALEAHKNRRTVQLQVCENGFIGINPPLTGARLGSLSTRTANPVFIGHIQGVLNAAGLRVQIELPYQLATKGEMLLACGDQNLLKAKAALSTSCGRFQRYNYRHCGRCVPCQIRRAAFRRWGIADRTEYVFENLGKNDPDHARFDDVRSVAMAIAEVKSEGLDKWLGTAISSALLPDVAPIKAMIQRGLDELEVLHKSYGVR